MIFRKMSRNSRMSLNLYPAQKHTGSSPLGFGAAPPRVRPGAKHTRQSQRGGGSCARSGVWRQGLRLRSRQRISPRCTKTPAAAPEEGRTCSSRPNVQARGTPGTLHLPAPAGFPGKAGAGSQKRWGPRMNCTSRAKKPGLRRCSWCHGEMLQTRFLSLEWIPWTHPCSFTFLQPPMSSRRNSLAFPL